MPDPPTNVMGPIISHISCPHVPSLCSYFPFDALVAYDTKRKLETMGKENICVRNGANICAAATNIEHLYFYKQFFVKCGHDAGGAVG